MGACRPLREQAGQATHVRARVEQETVLRDCLRQERRCRRHSQVRGALPQLTKHRRKPSLGFRGPLGSVIGHGSAPSSPEKMACTSGRSPRFATVVPRFGWPSCSDGTASAAKNCNHIRGGARKVLSRTSGRAPTPAGLRARICACTLDFKGRRSPCNACHAVLCGAPWARPGKASTSSIACPP